MEGRANHINEMTGQWTCLKQSLNEDGIHRMSNGLNGITKLLECDFLQHCLHGF